MSESNLIAVLVVSALTAIILTILVPTYLNIQAGTERLTSCVEAGGSYVKIPEVSLYECEQP